MARRRAPVFATILVRNCKQTLAFYNLQFELETNLYFLERWSKPNDHGTDQLSNEHITIDHIGNNNLSCTVNTGNIRICANLCNS